jgi:hypothetical protein
MSFSTPTRQITHRQMEYEPHGRKVAIASSWFRGNGPGLYLQRSRLFVHIDNFWFARDPGTNHYCRRGISSRKCYVVEKWNKRLDRPKLTDP